MANGISEVHYGADGMPRAHRGNRVPITIRLPFDLYREVALRANARNWSMSDFIGFCVARELADRYRPVPPTHSLPIVPPAGWIEEEWVPRTGSSPDE